MRKFSVLTNSNSSLLLSSSTAAASVALTSQRNIRGHHNYRHERYHKLLKQRFRYSRQWELPWGFAEDHTTTGHELESFENFGRYMKDSRAEESVEVSTDDLMLLDPRSRINTIFGTLEKRYLVPDGRGDMQRIRLTVMAAEAFEQICLKSKYPHRENSNNTFLPRPTIHDMSEDEQYHFRSCMRQVVNLVSKARVDHPDSITAAMRVVQIATNVRDDDERRWLLDKVRGYVNDLGEAHPPPRLTKIELRQIELRKKQERILLEQQQQNKNKKGGKNQQEEEEVNNNKKSSSAKNFAEVFGSGGVSSRMFGGLNRVSSAKDISSLIPPRNPERDGAGRPDINNEDEEDAKVHPPLRLFAPQTAGVQHFVKKHDEATSRMRNEIRPERWYKSRILRDVEDVTLKTRKFSDTE